MSKQRWMIVSDDSGHDYVIKVEEEKDFDAWVAATEADEDTELDFDEYRIGGSPRMLSFTDPTFSYGPGD